MIIALALSAVQMRQVSLFFAVKWVCSLFFYTHCIARACPKNVENSVENVENPCVSTLFLLAFLKKPPFSPLGCFTLRFIPFTICP